MARTILWCALVLFTATVTSGVRYSDYADLKLPEYGSAIDYDGLRDSQLAPPEPDDYHDDHTADASAPMDYNEDARVNPNKRSKEVVEPEEWQNSLKKHHKYLENESHENSDIYSLEESNFKSNHRPSKHRPRLKPKHLDEEDLPEVRNKHVVRYGTSKKEKTSDLESNGSIDGLEEGFEDDKRIDFDEDEMERRKNHKEATLKEARRKPRDRFIKSELTLNEEDPTMNIRKRPVEDELGPESVTRSKALDRLLHTRRGAETDAKTGLDEKRYLNEDKYDYADYYDMKRVQSVKEKLMKEKIDSSPRHTLHPYPKQSRGRLQDGDDDRSDEYGLEGLRRFIMPKSNEANVKDELEWNIRKQPARPTLIPTSEKAETSKISKRPLVDAALRIILSRTYRPETTTTSMKTTTTSTSTTTTPVRAKSTKLVNVTVEVTKVEEEGKETETSKSTTTEMSLAEKAKLLILKKAERRKMLKESAIKKPPVILQVTNRRHTFVMVESSTRLAPWKDVAEIMHDSPENLVRVKRLMRKKLVENAKDVHELSENWDDLICDYVDMSVIEQPSAASNTSLNYILMLLAFTAITLL